MPIDRRAFLTTAAAAAAASGSTAAMGAGRQRARVWEVGEKGGFDTMRLVERDVPAPGRGQVMVDVAMSAVAGRDQAIVRGWFLTDKPPTLIPLSEGVGTVIAVGEDVDRIKTGDRVVCCHFASWVDGPWTQANYAADVGNNIDGWLGEKVLLPESGLAVLPDNVSDETAATMTGSGVTSWHALHEVAQVKSGDVVLTLGTGGVSSWGLLLAKAAGARVVVTSSSDEKLEKMRGLGADYTVNYRKTPDWGKAVMELTGGVDIVLENVGRPTLDESMQACANNAMIVMIGTGPVPEQLPKMPGFYIKNLSMKAISNASRRMLEDMVRAVAANDIQAVIGGRYAFSDAVEAFEFMSQSSHIGKVIIDHKA